MWQKLLYSAFKGASIAALFLAPKELILKGIEFPTAYLILFLLIPISLIFLFNIIGKLLKSKYTLKFKEISLPYVISYISFLLTFFFSIQYNTHIQNLSAIIIGISFFNYYTTKSYSNVILLLVCFFELIYQHLTFGKDARSYVQNRTLGYISITCLIISSFNLLYFKLINDINEIRKMGNIKEMNKYENYKNNTVTLQRQDKNDIVYFCVNNYTLNIDNKYIQSLLNTDSVVLKIYSFFKKPFKNFSYLFERNNKIIIDYNKIDKIDKKESNDDLKLDEMFGENEIELQLNKASRFYNKENKSIYDVILLLFFLMQSFDPIYPSLSRGWGDAIKYIDFFDKKIVLFVFIFVSFTILLFSTLLFSQFEKIFLNNNEIKKIEKNEKKEKNQEINDIIGNSHIANVKKKNLFQSFNAKNYTSSIASTFELVNTFLWLATLEFATRDTNVAYPGRVFLSILPILCLQNDFMTSVSSLWTCVFTSCVQLNVNNENQIIKQRRDISLLTSPSISYASINLNNKMLSPIASPFTNYLTSKNEISQIIIKERESILNILFYIVLKYYIIILFILGIHSRYYSRNIMPIYKYELKISPNVNKNDIEYLNSVFYNNNYCSTHIDSLGSNHHPHKYINQSVQNNNNKKDIMSEHTVSIVSNSYLGDTAWLYEVVNDFNIQRNSNSVYNDQYNNVFEEKLVYVELHIYNRLKKNILLYEKIKNTHDYKENDECTNLNCSEYIIQSKKQTYNPFKYSPNKSNECLPYIQFFIERYDCLPDYIILLHGHQKSYHNKDLRPLFDINNNFRWLFNNNTNKDKIFSLNMPSKRKFTLSQVYGLFPIVIPGWKLIFPTQRIPNKFVYNPNAQFAVARKHVQQHPKQFWIDLLLSISYSKLTYPFREYDRGIICEFFWNILFNEEAENVSFIPDVV